MKKATTTMKQADRISGGVREQKAHSFSMRKAVSKVSAAGSMSIDESKIET